MFFYIYVYLYDYYDYDNYLYVLWLSQSDEVQLVLHVIHALLLHLCSHQSP